MATVHATLTGLGFRLEAMGGNCTGYVRATTDGREELLTVAGEARAPSSYHDPVSSSDSDGDGSDAQSWATLEAYLDSIESDDDTCDDCERSYGPHAPCRCGND